VSIIKNDILEETEEIKLWSGATSLFDAYSPPLEDSTLIWPQKGAKSTKTKFQGL